MTDQLIVGEQYRISGWVRNQDVSGGGAISFGVNYVTDTGFIPSDGHVRSVFCGTGTQDWHFCESDVFVLPPMPPSTVALHFAMDFSDSSGTAWFDDMQLIRPTVPEPSGLALVLISLLTVLRHRRNG